MLKRIAPSEVELGMFVHKLEGSWLKHPFWKTKFVLEDTGTLRDLRDADIEAVVIDIEKGKDVRPRPVLQAQNDDAPSPAAAPRARPALGQPSAFDYRSTTPQTTAREFGHPACLQRADALQARQRIPLPPFARLLGADDLAGPGAEAFAGRYPRSRTGRAVVRRRGQPLAGRPRQRGGATIAACRTRCSPRTPRWARISSPPAACPKRLR